MRHPRFLKNQIRYEIQSSLKSFPATTLLMLPWFQAEVMGYSRLYDDVSEYGWLYFAFSIPLYVAIHLSPLTLTRLQILGVHRVSCILGSSCSASSYTIQNLPQAASQSAKYMGSFFSVSCWFTCFPAVPTPFASHALHPVDEYMQSIPYHLFVFLFPLHRGLYLCLFVLVNLWTIFVCRAFPCTFDADTNVRLRRSMIQIWWPVIRWNTSLTDPRTTRCIIFISRLIMAKYFQPVAIDNWLLISSQQYFTWVDRASGSYRHPESHLDPLLEVTKEKTLWVICTLADLAPCHLSHTLGPDLLYSNWVCSTFLVQFCCTYTCVRVYAVKLVLRSRSVTVPGAARWSSFLMVEISLSHAQWESVIWVAKCSYLMICKQ